MAIRAGPSAAACPVTKPNSLLLLGWLLAGIASAQQVVNVSNGQQFVDSVLQWVSQGGSVTLAMAPGDITLAGTAWPSNRSAHWQQLTAALTIAGNAVLPYGQQALAKGDATVLDFAMKSSLTPPFDNPAITLGLQNVVLVNLCAVQYPYPARNSSLIFSYRNQLMPLAGQTGVIQTRSNVTLYGSQDEVTTIIYWSVMLRIPFEDVYTFTVTKLLNITGPVIGTIASVSRYRLLTERVQFAGGTDVWFDFRSTSNPADPLRLASLGGTLMEHRLCNTSDGSSLGPLLTSSQKTSQSSLWPIWFADNEQELGAALVEISAHAVARDVDPYLALMITGNVTVPAPSWTLRSDVIVVGPFNAVPGFKVPVSIDLSVASFQLLNSRLMLANLTVRGLTSQTLPGTTLSSALGFSAVRGGGGQGVRLANVQLVVPQADFAALLSAALRGPLWLSGAQTTAALMSGINVFQLDSSQELSRDQLVLTAYKGWGVDATNLTVVPDTPLPSRYVLPDGATLPTGISSGSSGLSDGAKIGIGIGAGIGAMLVVVLTVSTIWRHISCQHHTKSGKKDNEDLTPWEVMVITSDDRTTPALQEGLPSGLLPGDPFISAANRFNWVDYQPNEHTTWVESDINDMHLDGLYQDGTCPAVELKAADMGQIELLTNGLIGKGGAALVFACRWPSRFGPDALLAVKVLRNVYNASPIVLHSFGYEAELLACLRSPHVVKLYGYCLELPVVALIMELLPTSLESLLHPEPQKAPFYRMFPDALAVQLSGSVTGQAVVPLPERLGLTSAEVTPSGGTDTTIMAVTNSTHEDHTAADAPVHITKEAEADHQAEGAEAADSAQSRSTLSMLSVLQIAAGAAAGLAYLHNRTLESVASEPLSEPGSTLTEQPSVSAGGAGGRPSKIVHRDLKPANLLINTCGQAKLVDFGLAREFATTTMHTMHAGAGTLLYMAPELLASRMYTGALPFKPTYLVDIYSLGILMWEMLSQQKPWQDMNMAQLVAAVCGQQRPPMPGADQIITRPTGPVDLASIPAGFGIIPEFDNLIKRCWQHRDHKRPQASEVHRQLQLLLQQAEQQYPHHFTSPPGPV